MSSNTFDKWTGVRIKNGTDTELLAMLLEDIQAAGLIDLSQEISLVEPDKEFSLEPLQLDSVAPTPTGGINHL